MKLAIKKIVSKVMTFDRVMFVRQCLFKQPAQTVREIKIIKELFLYFKQKKLLVFEYGSGYSTVYYAQYLHNKGYRFEWHAIDNSDVWFRKVRTMIEAKGLNKHVFLHSKSFKPFWEKPGWDFSQPVKCGRWQPASESENNYINFPKTSEMNFDIVFIDGRFRRRCLLVAKQCLKHDGIVVLHDAQKPHYHSSLKHYPHQTFINGGRFYPGQEICNSIWFGSNDNLHLTKDIGSKFSKFLVKREISK